LTFDLILSLLHNLLKAEPEEHMAARARPGRSAADGGRPLRDGELRNILVRPRPLLCARLRLVDTAGLSVDPPPRG